MSVLRTNGPLVLEVFQKSKTLKNAVSVQTVVCCFSPKGSFNKPYSTVPETSFLLLTLLKNVDFGYIVGLQLIVRFVSLFWKLQNFHVYKKSFLASRD